MSIGNAWAIWWRQGWKTKNKKKMKNIKWWPRCSRSYPKIGHEIVEPIASVSWRIRWRDISCVPSRHQYDKERRNEVQGQDEPSQRDHMLEAFHPYGDHGYVKICLKESLSHRSMVEQLARLHQAGASMLNQEMCSNLRRTRSPSSSLSGMQGKGIILIGFLFYRSHGACWVTG